MNYCEGLRDGESHCALCHRTFRGLTLFDAHQDVNYRRKRAGVVLCVDPHSLGLVQTERGTWTTPEGLKHAQILRERLSAARSARSREVAALVS